MDAAQASSRELTTAYQAALARERSAWEYLQHARMASAAPERQARLQSWIDCMRELRETQDSLTKRLTHEASANYRKWLHDDAHSRLAPALPTADIDAPAKLTLVRSAPRAGERMRARDGSVWWVESVALDSLDEGHFLAHIRRGPIGNKPADVMEVFGDDWPLICLVHGLEPLAA